MYNTKINKTVDGGLYRIGDSSEYNPSSVHVEGAILNDKDFRNILILVDEPIDGDSKSWTGDGGLFIVAPSDTRNEALDRAKSLSKKSHWLEQMDWE